ncbi:MAG TPA: caspase domain-containing protein [Bacteroidales bacterium]|nr:caspase domain-containing protein [Bacteroidales bacterium]
MKKGHFIPALALSLILCNGYVSAQKNPITSSAERRLALVIGNAGYLHSPALANPVNDARSMKDALQSLGFDVFEYEDVNQSQMKEAIDKFGTRLKNYSVGLFFYSGHGIQSKGANYLIPVDANIQSEQQIEYDCVQADRVLGFMEAAGSKVNIVILDACRNNPFERSWSRAVEGSGLAFMNAPTGSLIAYSTSPGRTASDGSGSNGLYTAALLENLKTPDVTILQMFQNVRRSVSDKSYKQQIPWESTSLTNDFFFVNKAAIMSKTEFKITWQHTDTMRYRLQINEEDVSSRVVSDWADDDLLVWDPVSNVTCVLENFVKKPYNVNLDARLVGSTADAYWRAKNGFYYLYYKGEQVAARTKNTFVGKDVLVYDVKTNNTYLLKDYKANSDNKIRPAELFDNADYAFWRKQDDGSYWLYVKGDNIQDRTNSGYVDKDLVVYDTTSNITYLFKDFDNPANVMKLLPASIVSYQDNTFWQKKEKNLYYLITKGTAIQNHTTNELKGDDLYVTDTKTGIVYIFPNWTTATDGVLKVALRN